MPTVRVYLQIPVDEMLAFYKGHALSVRAQAADGRYVRFPATVLRRFVTPEGVHGSFLLHFDDDNRFQGIERVE